RPPAATGPTAAGWRPESPRQSNGRSVARAGPAAAPPRPGSGSLRPWPVARRERSPAPPDAGKSDFLNQHPWSGLRQVFLPRQSLDCFRRDLATYCVEQAFADEVLIHHLQGGLAHVYPERLLNAEGRNRPAECACQFLLADGGPHIYYGDILATRTLPPRALEYQAPGDR